MEKVVGGQADVEKSVDSFSKSIGNAEWTVPTFNRAYLMAMGSNPRHRFKKFLDLTFFRAFSDASIGFNMISIFQ